MSAPHRPSRWAQEEGINLTPLLDVIFNLIFFFILATSLREDKALDIRLPETKDAEAVVSEKQTITVLITKENKILLDGDELSPEEMTERLSKKKVEIGEAFGGVFIEGDQTSHLQTMIETLGVVQDAGIYQVRFKATLPGGGAAE
jgi:biopolymer transport protein ExbD